MTHTTLSSRTGNAYLREAVEAHQAAVADFFARYGEKLEGLAEILAASIRSGGKLLLCGNGGSACDAMHVAGEFVGRLRHDRPALPAIALSSDGGILTAIGNDYGFREVFARQVEALGQHSDMLIALSTSGQSENVLAALAAARKKGMITVLLTGKRGEKQGHLADHLFTVADTDTARIQEVHITALHVFAALAEQALFSERP